MKKAAQAAEETRPREAIEIYQRHAEQQIGQKQRKYDQYACEYLVKVRALYEKIGENEGWKRYIAALREKYHTLRALKEEIAKAEL